MGVWEYGSVEMEFGQRSSVIGNRSKN